MSEVLRRLAALASTQREVVSRDQATACGLTPVSLHRAIVRGVLIPVGTHTFRFAGTDLTWRGMLQAGLLDLGTDAWVDAGAAAALHGLEGFGEGPLEFVVLRANRNRRTVGRVRSIAALPRLDRTSVDGLRCVTAARAVIDAAGSARTASLEAAVESGGRRGLFTVPFLASRLEVLGPRWPGSARLREVLAEGGVESWLERRFLRLIRAAGRPAPAVQRVYRRKGGIARVDFDFEPRPVIVEVGGRRGYLTPSDRQRKERRRNELQLLGKVVYFFTTEDVTDTPDDVIATVRAALGAAA